MLNKIKKEPLKPEDIQLQQRVKTAQQWMPINDIDKSIVYRKDNLLVGALRVQPENLELLSDSEKRRKIESLAEELNGEKEGLQIFCIGRPVDLNNYLEWLQEKAKTEQDFTRKRVLRGYISQASEMASSGETTERRFYIIITKKVGIKAEEELLGRLRDLQNKISSAELVSELCNEDELMDLYSLFANPIQASFEKVTSQLALPTLLEY